MQQSDMLNNFPTIGVTGITGSGTSTVSAILEERGGYVIEADKLAHDTMGKKEPAYAEIVNHFGKDILNANCEINRRALGKKVFGDKEEMARLEKIIHPAVVEKTRKIIENLADNEEFTFAVIDAPLLIESGMNTLCDSIWLITAPDELRIQRVTARDGIDENAVRRRLQSRKGDTHLREHANITIENDGSAIALRSKIEVALKAMSLNRHGWRDMEVLEL
ncbi:MAG: dephospho-CoA kinase [Defluviitaleaceae bacterium]|nr:dephospho-CoA kinase [Defluviitaleaceae bacterium]